MRLLLFLAFLLVACDPGTPAADAPRSDIDAEGVLTSTQEATGTLDLREATSQDIKAYLAGQPAKVTIVNFWATWCVPCREEFPDIVRVGQELQDQGVEVLFVSADFTDQREAVQQFLLDHGVEGVSFLKNEADDPFISAFDTEWMGELPATIVFNEQDEKVTIIRDKTTYDALRAIALNELKPGSSI